MLIWNVRAEAVVFKAEHKNVQQLLLLDDDSKCVTVSKVRYDPPHSSKLAEILLFRSSVETHDRRLSSTAIGKTVYSYALGNPFMNHS